MTSEISVAIPGAVGHVAASDCQGREAGSACPATITITRQQIYKSPNRNARFAWKWIYDAIGPDGRRFDNDSIVALRGVLRRAYGRDTKLVESWKAESND